jgi:predicted transposase/invertase (TIGR01784 family)
MVTIELEKLEKDDTLSCPLRDWLVYLKEGWKDAAVTAELGSRTEGIREAEEICMELSSKWDYWAKVQEDMHERDRENELRFARTEALEQGKKQGLDLGKQQVARNMKASGMPVSQIAQLSGLSEEEVEKL